MKITNSKDIRKNKILAMDSKRFNSYFDYYVFLHLNEKVLLFHVIGMLTGLFFLGLSFYTFNFWYLIPFIITLNGFPHGSHIFIDGLISPATAETFGLSIFYAFKLNFIFMFTNFKKYKANFLEKYPFAEEAYN
jgi:hypothetical protein